MNDQADTAAVADDIDVQESPASSMTEALAAQGFAVVDGYPANHRLRAEALVADGKEEDPAGHVSRELIADTADRLKRETADAADGHPDLMKKTRPELVTLAAEVGAVHESDANKATIVRAIIEKSGTAAASQEG